MRQVPAAPASFTPKDKPGVASQFLSWFLEKLCDHEFSWPQTGAQGRDYQVCVVCGSAYEYDWTTMQRTRRITSLTGDDGTMGAPQNAKA